MITVLSLIALFWSMWHQICRYVQTQRPSVFQTSLRGILATPLLTLSANIQYSFSTLLCLSHYVSFLPSLLKRVVLSFKKIYYETNYLLITAFLIAMAPCFNYHFKGVNWKSPNRACFIVVPFGSTVDLLRPASDIYPCKLWHARRSVVRALLGPYTTTLHVGEPPMYVVACLCNNATQCYLLPILGKNVAHARNTNQLATVQR